MMCRRTKLLLLGLVVSSSAAAAGEAGAENARYASESRKNAAVGHYARARSMLVEALAEFEQAKKLARPDMLVDPEEWRLSIVSRTEELNRLIDPKPRVTRDGVRFQANQLLVRREKDRTPRPENPASDSTEAAEAAVGTKSAAKSGSSYGAGAKGLSELSAEEVRARLDVPEDEAKVVVIPKAEIEHSVSSKMPALKDEVAARAESQAAFSKGKSEVKVKSKAATELPEIKAEEDVLPFNSAELEQVAEPVKAPVKAEDSVKAEVVKSAPLKAVVSAEEEVPTAALDKASAATSAREDMKEMNEPLLGDASAQPKSTPQLELPEASPTKTELPVAAKVGRKPLIPTTEVTAASATGSSAADVEDEVTREIEKSIAQRKAKIEQEAGAGKSAAKDVDSLLTDDGLPGFDPEDAK